MNLEFILIFAAALLGQAAQEEFRLLLLRHGGNAGNGCYLFQVPQDSEDWRINPAMFQVLCLLCTGFVTNEDFQNCPAVF